MRCELWWKQPVDWMARLGRRALCFVYWTTPARWSKRSVGSTNS
jgi:hypothetical protein